MPTKPLAHSALDALGRVEPLDIVGKPLGKKIRKLIPKGPIKDTLSGTQLGHALHPLLTDVPIGTWLSAAILDATGEEKAADRLIGAGLAATLPTLWTGWNDWADAEPASDAVRRVGLTHALVNGTAATLHLASYVARRNGNRSRGKLLSLAGMGLLGAGGWLGGHLSYAQGVGVDTTVFETGAEDWTPAADTNELTDGVPLCATVAGQPVLLVRRGETIHALANRCTHRGGPLHEGMLDGDTITCPWHGTCFKLEDGSVERGPAAYPQPVYDVRTLGTTVEVRRRAR
jgi:nitrite reductase/ring-hydroxylating ferredoxin subunit/uncharacterized membrane protein